MPSELVAIANSYGCKSSMLRGDLFNRPFCRRNSTIWPRSANRRFSFIYEYSYVFKNLSTLTNFAVAASCLSVVFFGTALAISTTPSRAHTNRGPVFFMETSNSSDLLKSGMLGVRVRQVNEQRSFAREIVRQNSIGPGKRRNRP